MRLFFLEAMELWKLLVPGREGGKKWEGLEQEGLRQEGLGQEGLGQKGLGREGTLLVAMYTHNAGQPAAAHPKQRRERGKRGLRGMESHAKVGLVQGIIKGNVKRL